MTPLQTSCYYGQLDIMQELLQHLDIQIDKPSQGFQGATCLMLACRQKDPEAVRLLLENYANVQANTHTNPKYGWTAEQIALNTRNAGIIGLINKAKQSTCSLSTLSLDI